LNTCLKQALPDHQRTPTNMDTSSKHTKPPSINSQ
jgi:hypothetical protein